MPSNSGYKWIKEEEGFVPVAKRLRTQGGGTEKVRTIGYGYNVDAQANPLQDFMNAGIPAEDAELILSGRKPIDKSQADRLYNISLSRAASQAADVIPNLADQPDPIKDVLVGMAYQMGEEGLRGFRKMRAALAVNDYEKVAQEIMDSKFARENSTARAKRTAKKVLDYSKSLPPKPKQPTQAELVQEAKKDATANELAKLYSSSILEKSLTDMLVQMQMSNNTEDKKEDTE